MRKLLYKETCEFLSDLLADYIQNIETGYYERGDDYYSIRDYKNTSVHQVCYMI